MTNADVLTTGLNNVFDKETQDDLKVSLSGVLGSNNDIVFRKASTNINVILDENKTQIKGVVTNFNKIPWRFAQNIHSY
jgi:phospholipid/cholesterol/gamma-HCH transport system substrate-binding protein